MLTCLMECFVPFCAFFGSEKYRTAAIVSALLLVAAPLFKWPISKQEEEEGISSPIAAQILDFCDEDVDGHLFPSADQLNSLAILPSDEQAFSCSSPAASTTVAAVRTGVSTPAPLLCFTEDASFSPFTTLDAATLSALLDAPPVELPFPEDDLLPAVRYPSSSPSSSLNPLHAMFPAQPPYAGDLHLNILEKQVSIDDAATSRYRAYSPDPASAPITSAMGPQSRRQQQESESEAGYYAAALAGMQQQTGFGGMEAAPPCLALEGGGVGPMYYVGAMAREEGPHGLFYTGTGGVMGAGDAADYQRLESGFRLYGKEAPPYSSNDLQVLGVGGGSQSLMAGSSGNPAPLPASSAPAMDENNYKVGRLSVKERKEKIHRYMKKRNERNFSKKIKYACRKTLADSRPRVRGRFAKNDDFVEITKAISSNTDFDDEEDVRTFSDPRNVMVKEEDDIIDPSDILAHISTVNSLKYNFTLESWI